MSKHRVSAVVGWLGWLGVVSSMGCARTVSEGRADETPQSERPDVVAREAPETSAPAVPDGFGAEVAGAAGWAVGGVEHTGTLALPGLPARAKSGPIGVDGGDGVVDEASRWAFERLAPDHPEQAFLAALLVEVEASTGNGVKPERVGEAVGRLVAAFRQLLDDEDNGRDQLQASPFWGASSSSVRRELRRKLAQLVRSRHGDRAALAIAPVVEWLLFEERVFESIEDGLKLLAVLPEAAQRPIVERILCESSPVRDAMRFALERGARWKSRCLEERAAEMVNHPDPNVAKVARTIVKQSAVAPHSVKAFPASVALLESLERMVPFQLAGGALETFELTYPGGGKSRTVVGVVLGDDGDQLVIGTVHGQWERVSKRAESGVRVSRKVASLDELVQTIGKARQMTDREKRAEVLSSSGMLTGQFEAGFVSVMELMVARALDAQGRRADALELITPMFGEVPDLRWVTWAARDVLAQRSHEEMLVRWTIGRDIDAALGHAERLCGADFAGYSYQTRTCFLAQQLKLRRDDWKAFTLPTREQWDAMKQGLSREAQLESLAERVRLRNTRQWGQPGGVDFMDAQYDRSLDSLDRVEWAARANFEVINPLVEIKAMAPTVAERAILRRYVDSPVFMAMYSYWRDFHPGRELHTVGEAMTWLLAEIEKANTSP